MWHIPSSFSLILSFAATLLTALSQDDPYLLSRDQGRDDGSLASIYRRDDGKNLLGELRPVSQTWGMYPNILSLPMKMSRRSPLHRSKLGKVGLVGRLRDEVESARAIETRANPTGDKKTGGSSRSLKLSHAGVKGPKSAKGAAQRGKAPKKVAARVGKSLKVPKAGGKTTKKTNKEASGKNGKPSTTGAKKTSTGRKKSSTAGGKKSTTGGRSTTVKTHGTGTAAKGSGKAATSVGEADPRVRKMQLRNPRRVRLPLGSGVEHSGGHHGRARGPKAVNPRGRTVTLGRGGSTETTATSGKRPDT